MTQGAPQELQLEVASVSLPLRDDVSGLLLEEKGPLAPLCRLANVLVTGYSFSLSDREQIIGRIRVVPKPDGRWLIESEGAGVVVSRAALFECIEKLMAVRMPMELFWLLRHDALFWRPSPADRELARELEARAAAGSPNPILLRALMIEMESVGLFDEAGSMWRIDAVREMGHPILVSYAQAARIAHEYFRSAERKKLLPEAPPSRFLERHVSIEWFRGPQSPPADATLFAWTASCEYTLMRNDFADLAEGHVLQRWGRSWYRMHWTQAYGLVPALDRVEAIPD
jgi:hypothetical protein